MNASEHERPQAAPTEATDFREAYQAGLALAHELTTRIRQLEQANAELRRDIRRYTSAAVAGSGR